jgi:bifunctional UDP-N-acetylglucosamine pyrophosphorylase / glucosamine-1-phosphate N-acetyltransferase
MSGSIGIIILAAGKGTRMKVDHPKALVPALGKPLLDYVVESSFEFSRLTSLSASLAVVVGHRKDLLEAWWDKHSLKHDLKLAWQREQKGTADALKACFNDLPEFWKNEYTLVTCADTPLITAEEFKTLFHELKTHPSLVGVAATFETSSPAGYGRIVKSDLGFKIVEEKDATEIERNITEVNSGVYILKTKHIEKVLNSIGNNNKSGEFYLTDLFQDHYPVRPVKFAAENPFLGINTMEQLAQVNEQLQARKLKQLMLDGVMILNPKNTLVEMSVEVGVGSILYPGIALLGKTKIGKEVTIEPGSLIKNSSVGDKVEILANSHLEGAVVHSAATIGPMARLRPGSDIGPEAKIGNFVEIKKSKLEQAVKVSHLSYVGDAEIGAETNIGCGFITCNYDGVNKHKTKIGSGTFIGSDCQVIAPIEIGNDAFVAAGSTITKSIPDDGFAIARSQQMTKEGAAKRFLKKKKN